MLLQNWTLKHPEYGDLPCSVPFSMYGTLLAAGKINDPYYRDNEYALKPLSNEDYTFETTFEADKARLAKAYQLLRFEGIDTIATLYLNDIEIGQAFNMHRTWEFDVREALRLGTNRLTIEFHSPVKYMEAEQARHYVWGQDGDIITMDGFAHIRKAASMFGWDWAPQLPDMGLFRPVTWISYDTDRISDVRIRQFHKNGKVTLKLEAESEHNAANLTFTVRVTGPSFDETVTLVRGKGQLTIDEPQLWWPNGYGKQPLYTVSVSLFGGKGGKDLLDTWTRRIGLRTLTVSTAKDQWGNEFCFVINGKKMFAMGADYVPEDSLLGNNTHERTRRLLESCVKANYNSVRIWGGGCYPSNEFYDACDELGLVVWQDFMFACVNVYLSEKFTANIRQEFIDNIRRLRDHASLGLFCGNNEMEDAVMSWDGCKDSEVERMDYLQLYEHILPDLCEKYCPDTFYWPSSPSSHGGFDNPQDENRGDAHYWGAWHGSIPFESYRQHYFRFCSEFGFEAFPNMKTIRAYAEPEDMNPFSLVMESHQKCLSGNTKILSYASDKYLYPYDFKSLVYTAQLLQADAIRYGVEHFRRFRGRCMGAIYWQLNDCWPVASWASVDYYGRWKALMYSSKRFYAPVLLSAHEDGLRVVLNLSSESPEAFAGTLRWRVIDRDFKVFAKGEMAANIGALSTKDLLTLDLTKAIQGHEKERMLAYDLYGADGSLISHSSLLFCKPKHFDMAKPDVKVTITGGNGRFDITVSASTYVKSLEIDFDNHDALLSDNYFDITSAEVLHLTAEVSDASVTAEELMADLTLQSVYDIGR